ncbi:MAG TPA: GGDEF domain-containing protein [Gammaproteobacteria bacterium]|nr:GGDEF domain-containing protein [Gammaproteobacteria bacterium]
MVGTGFRITTSIIAMAVSIAVGAIAFNSWLVYSSRLDHTREMIGGLVQYELRDRLKQALAEKDRLDLETVARTLEEHMHMADVPPLAVIVDGQGRFVEGVRGDQALRRLLEERDLTRMHGTVETGGFVLMPEHFKGFDGAVVFGFRKADVRATAMQVAGYTALVVAFLLVLFVTALRLILRYRLERPFEALLNRGLDLSTREPLAGLDSETIREPDVDFLPARLGHQVTENFQLLALWHRNKVHVERLISFGIRETDKQAFLQYFQQSLRELFGVQGVLVMEANSSQNRLITTYQSDSGPQPVEGLLGNPESCFAFRTGTSARQSCEQTLCPWGQCKPHEVLLCMPLIGGGRTIGICSVTIDRNALEWKVPMAWPYQRKVQLVESFLRPYLNLTALTLNSLNLLDAYKNQAITDALTGLHNRRYAIEYLNNMVNIAKRQEIPVGVLVVDIDWFKRFNDEYGHKVGDRVLRQVAHTMRNVVREGDLVARYGGEEFLVVLPDANAELSMEIAERLRTAVEAIEWDQVDVPGIPPVTITVGLAGFPLHGYSYYHLIHKADHALYQAKSAGKNRVGVHEHLPATEGTDAPAPRNAVEPGA